MKKKYLIIICLILTCICLFIYLNRSYSKSITLYINDEKIKINSSSSDDVNLKTFNSLKNTYVKVSGNGKINITINGKKISEFFKTNLGKIRVDGNSKLKVVAKFKGKTVKFNINTVPDSFPEFDVEESGDKYSGNYYMSTYSTNEDASYIFILNKKGNILYYKNVSGFSSKFRKEKSSDGKIRYCYMVQTLNSPKIDDGKKIYGKFVVMDENFNVIDEATYKTDDKKGLTYSIFTYIDDKHYLLTSPVSKPKYDDPDVTVIHNNIQEIKNNKVIFEWKSEDHKELFDYVDNIDNFSKNEENDYLHINKIFIDSIDNNIVASFRHISTVLKINRKTGKIIWSLGGKKDDFGLTDDEKFEYQHDPTFTSDHSLMIFDNRINIPAKGIKEESRVIKLKLDEKNKKVLSFKAYKLKNVYSMAMGSVQEIDSDGEVFLISYGNGIFERGPVELIDFKNDKVLFSFNLYAERRMFSCEKN